MAQIDTQIRSIKLIGLQTNLMEPVDYFAQKLALANPEDIPLLIRDINSTQGTQQTTDALRFLVKLYNVNPPRSETTAKQATQYSDLKLKILERQYHKLIGNEPSVVSLMALYREYIECPSEIQQERLKKLKELIFIQYPENVFDRTLSSQMLPDCQIRQ
jgi:hypothetical protein